MIDVPLILDGGRITLYHGDCLAVLPTLAAPRDGRGPLLTGDATCPRMD